MPQTKHKDEEVQSLFFRMGGVPIRSHIRAFALQATMSTINRLLRNLVKQSRGGEACEEFAVAWCGFALTPQSVFAGGLSGEVIRHVL
jgi:hypothetical protein